MQLEAGKFYHDEGGTLWGPLSTYGRGQFCVAGPGYLWNADGTTPLADLKPLVSEAPDPRRAPE